MSIFKNMEPGILWKYFEEICEIPRPSRQEDQIISYLTKFANDRKLEIRKDHAGNLLISKPATKGMENRETLVLQSHMDMVGEKHSGVDHDFSKDPIKPFIENGWVKAKGTTLGADDGIGIAAQLGLLASSDISHGKIECLFTVDEETGLSGAFAIQPGFFEGKILINLDSEDEGELFIGCAGGIDTIASMEFDREEVPDPHVGFRIRVGGLKGGHSGDDIHKGRGNSNKILNRFLWNINNRFDIRIISFDGGNLRNAIPREAEALFTVHRDDREEIKLYFESFIKDIKNELNHTDPDIAIGITPEDKFEKAIDEDTQLDLLYSLYACPNGVISWDHQIDGLVRTSTNLASVKFSDDKITITTSQRSSFGSEKADIASMVESVFRLANANIKKSGEYPGWEPDSESAIVKITAETYRQLFGNQPLVRAIHAGLECGLFLEKYPDLDMVSFGPTIKGAHSPDERLHIGSVRKFWNLLTEVLKAIPEKKQ